MLKGGAYSKPADATEDESARLTVRDSSSENG